MSSRQLAVGSRQFKGMSLKNKTSFIYNLCRKGQSLMSFRDLIVYKKSFAQAMEIFELSKKKNDELRKISEEIGRLLNHMINNPEKYQRKSESSNSRSSP